MKRKHLIQAIEETAASFGSNGTHDGDLIYNLLIKLKEIIIKQAENRNARKI